MQRVVHVTVEIADQVARQSEETPDAVAGHVMEYSAVENYRYGSLSHRHVGQLLGVDYWRTKTSLGNGTCRSGNGPFIWIGSRDAGFLLLASYRLHEPSNCLKQKTDLVPAGRRPQVRIGC